MIYDIKAKQWELIDSETPLYGHELIAQIMSSGEEILGAGTVMVFDWAGKPYLMFQTLLDIVLPTASDITLVAYEPGSIVFLGATGDKEFTPTLRFRDCRMPRKRELIRYNAMLTI